MSIEASLAKLFPDHLAVLAARTARALDITGYEALLVHSGSALPVFLDDQDHAFRANAPFVAWAPLTDAPDCFVHFVPGRKPRLLLLSPEDFWYKPATVPRSWWTGEFEIVEVATVDAARGALPADLSRTALIGAPGSVGASWKPAAVNPPALMTRLDYERAAKTLYELECLREASRIGARGHLAAAGAFAAGASEFEIELAFLAACGAREQELPYNPIIALNDGGAILHYQVLERAAPAQRRSLLIDAGARFAGYASDITRTYAGPQETDFAQLITGMDELQQALCAGVRAGADWRDVHLSAHRLIAELLHEAGIIRVGVEEAVDTGLSSVFFPHGLGHLLGLQVHDVGGTLAGPDGGEIRRPEGHDFLRLTRVLEERFVVTMEPGVYFIEPLLAAARANAHGARIDWARVDALRGCGGIRIEDDLAITSSGAENLTRDAFRALEAVTVAA